MLLNYGCETFMLRNFIRVHIHQFTLRHYAFGRRLGQLLLFQHSF